MPKILEGKQNRGDGGGGGNGGGGGGNGGGGNGGGGGGNRDDDKKEGGGGGNGGGGGGNRDDDKKGDSRGGNGGGGGGNRNDDKKGDSRGGGNRNDDKKGDSRGGKGLGGKNTDRDGDGEVDRSDKMIRRSEQRERKAKNELEDAEKEFEKEEKKNERQIKELKQINENLQKKESILIDQIISGVIEDEMQMADVIQNSHNVKNHFLYAVNNQNKSLEDNNNYLSGIYSADDQKVSYQQQHINYWVHINFYLFYLYTFLAIIYAIKLFYYDPGNLGLKIFWYLHILLLPYLAIYTEIALFFFFTYLYSWFTGTRFEVWKYFTSYPPIV